MVSVPLDRKATVPALTLTAYAARRGCSVKSVSRAVAAGRLVASVGRTERGIPTITDPDLADREWEANTRARVDSAPAAAPDTEPSAQPAQPAQPERIDDRSRKAAAQPESAQATRDLGEYYAHRAAREAFESRRAAAQAKLAELELATRIGELIDAKTASADVITAFSLVKTRLLALPSDLAQRMPDIADRVVPVVDAMIREALEELSASGGDGRAG